MYLVDANVFLEGLLEQEKTQTVRSFFQSTDLEKMFITDLTLHSIGIILFRLKKFELFVAFVNDMIIDGISILSLGPEDVIELHKIAQMFNLDFDDAYQYAVAEKHNLQLISFDRDFDRTTRRRKEPLEVIA